MDTYDKHFRLGMSVQNLWDTSTESDRETPWAPAETAITLQLSTVPDISRTGLLRASRWTATPRTRCTPARAAVWWRSVGYRLPPPPTPGTSTVRTVMSSSPVTLSKVNKWTIGSGNVIMVVLSAGNFTFVDHRIMQLMGYSPPELLGKSCFEFIHNEDQAHMKENFEQVEID